MVGRLTGGSRCLLERNNPHGMTGNSVDDQRVSRAACAVWRKDVSGKPTPPEQASQKGEVWPFGEAKFYRTPQDQRGLLFSSLWFW